MGNFEKTVYGRLLKIENFCREFFAREENKKFLALSEAIGADYDANGERLNKAMIAMFNRPMWRVRDYVPMNRMGQTGEANENRIIEDLLGVCGAGQKWVDRGWSEKRLFISPYHQAPVELGLHKTWAQSVSDTEHFLAYGPLVQRLNAVFKGNDASVVRKAINDRWGMDATKRIDASIAEFASPRATGNRGALDSFVRSLRGKTATAYLAWKMSGVLKQAVTSPWPYLQEIPPHLYIQAAFEVAGGFGKVNKFIREKSVFMNNRKMDPMMELIREQMEKNESGVMHGINKFNELGMRGLEAVDWAAVAPGWLAKYRMELANVAKEQEAEYQKLLEKYRGDEYSDVLPTEESKANKAMSEIMSEAEQDYEAVARADDAVRRMQPSSRNVDAAYMFKERGEIAKAFMQFQMALNVIWQNIRYDLPLAIKEKQTGTVVGMVGGYMMAGIGLGLLLDDDDEDEKRERNTALWLLYNSLTQFTDAVPLIGDEVNYLAERTLTGRVTFRGSAGNILPAVGKALGGAGDAASVLWEKDPEKQKKKFGKAAGKIGEAAGLIFGAPVSGVKEAGRAFGIGDGDGELGFNPEAFLGRRK